MSSDLVAFLRARLDEDEQAARAATPGPWRWGDWSTTFGTVEQRRRTLEHAPERGPFPAVATRDSSSRQVLPSLEDSLEMAGDREPYEANAAHIARHDPARVLAEVDAKRAIVDALGIAERNTADMRRMATEYRFVQVAESAQDALLYAVRLLALPYADHPDYRAEWAPTEEAHRG